VDERGHLGELRILARGGLVSLIGSTASALLGFGFVVVIGRTLSVRQAGGLFEAIAIFSIMSYATVLGADSGLLKLMPTIRVPRDLRYLTAVAVYPALLVSVAIAAGIFLNAGSIAKLLLHQGPVIAAAKELRLIAPFLPLATVMTIMLAGVRVWSVGQSVVIQGLLVPIGRFLLIGVFVAVGMTPLLGALAFAGPFAIGAIASRLLLHTHLVKPILVERASAKSLGIRADQKRLFVRFWRFSGPRSIGGLFSILLLSLDVVLLGALGRSGQVAAYNVASRYIIIGGFALSSVAVAIAPQLSRLWADHRTRAAQTVYRESTWWIMGISWPVLILMALFAPLLMSFVNSRYTAGIVALEILALATLVNTGTGNNLAAILMAGKSSTVLLIEATELTLNVALNVALIPRFGATGAAIAWSVSILFGAASASAVLFRIASIHPFGLGYWAVVLSAVSSYGVIGLVARLCFGATWTSGLAAAILGSGCYLGCLRLFHQRRWLNLWELRTLIAGTVESD
jgi:O-antigen/teichoic acid export membrane protein